MDLPYEDRLLDTNILLHYIRRDALAAWMEQTYLLLATPRQPLISIVVEGELRSLALQFGWGQRRLQRLEFLLDHLVKVPLEFEGLIDAYARIDHHARRTGRPIGRTMPGSRPRPTPPARVFSPPIEISTPSHPSS